MMEGKTRNQREKTEYLQRLTSRKTVDFSTATREVRSQCNDFLKVQKERGKV